MQPVTDKETVAIEEPAREEGEPVTAEGMEKRERESAASLDRMKSAAKERGKALSPGHEESLPERKMKKSAMIAESGAVTARGREQFDLNGTVVPGVAEADTSMSEDALRMHIQRWTAYIAHNPGDSLSLHGYEQVAIAYYLLSRLTRDEEVIIEGSRTVREYADRTDDPVLKSILLDKLQKINALRKK